MKIILLRHGESVDDVLNCYGGAADFDLSENGRETARKVAELYREKGVEMIYSSPLKRAAQTAQIIDGVIRCGVKAAPNLYERNSYGVMTGINKDECRNIFAYMFEQTNGKVGDYYSEFSVMGAEPVAEFDERVKIGMAETVDDAEANGYNSIIVVTHGNVLKSIFKNLLEMNGEAELDLLAVAELAFDDGAFVLDGSRGISISSSRQSAYK